MVTLEAFLSGVAKIKSEAPTYRAGGDGSDGTCDCIGLVIGAIRRAGGGWAGTHGKMCIRDRYNLVQNIDTTKSKAVMDSFAAVTKVPQSRFYTAIDLKDGIDHTGDDEPGSDETAGGYAKASGGKNINFMVIHKPAVIQFNKHGVNKIITPEQNQTSDGWMFFYRSYGLADVYDNKLAGIYLHAATT